MMDCVFSSHAAWEELVYEELEVCSFLFIASEGGPLQGGWSLLSLLAALLERSKTEIVVWVGTSHPYNWYF